MIKRYLKLMTCAIALLVSASSLQAKDLVVDLSAPIVRITTGFSGTELLLFGAKRGAGDVIVVGHAYSSYQSGHAYVYTRNLSSTPATQWKLAQKLEPDYTAKYFGFSVAIDKADDTIVVGAHKAQLGSDIDVGAAFVFARNSSNWTQVEVILPEEPAGTTLAAFEFGTSVAIDDGVIVVSKMRSADTSNLNPTAYVYERDDMDDVQSSWSFVSRLREEGDSEFARNVMVDGDTIA